MDKVTKEENTENLTEFIKGRGNVITNIDPDGIFSFVLLRKFFGCDVVGFTNSKEFVYLMNDRDTRRDKVTYVDMYVNPQDLHCIDQHIVSYTENNNSLLKSFKTKLNPNVWHNRSFENYRIKYPFSTFVYIGTLLDREGYSVDIDWHRKITDKLELGHILLRIDGVITNLLDYTDNCQEWLKWSEAYSNGGKFIMGMIQYIRDSLSVLDIKEKALEVEMFFKDKFNTETKDGGFKSIDKTNYENINSMFSFACECLDVEPINVFHEGCELTVYKGKKDLTAPLSEEDILKETFSYAIVNMRENNFSFTRKIRKNSILIL